MDDAWFKRCADELAQCLVDARSCSEACERYLERAQAEGDDEALARAVDLLVAPAAVSRVLIDLIDQPPQLVLAAARLCRDTAAAAAAALNGNDGAADAVAALERTAESAGRLLDAAG